MEKLEVVESVSDVPGDPYKLTGCQCDLCRQHQETVALPKEAVENGFDKTKEELRKLYGDPKYFNPSFGDE